MTNIRVTDLPKEVIYNLPAKEAMALVAAVPAFRRSQVLRTGVRHRAIRENLSEVMKSYGLDGPEISPTAITPEAVADQLQSLTELQNIPSRHMSSSPQCLSDEMRERLTRSIDRLKIPYHMPHQEDTDIKLIATDPNKMNEFRILAKFFCLSGEPQSCVDVSLRIFGATARKFLDQNADWCRANPWKALKTVQTIAAGGKAADFIKDCSDDWKGLSYYKMEQTGPALIKGEGTADFIRERFADWNNLSEFQMSHTDQALATGGAPADFVRERFDDWRGLDEFKMFQTRVALNMSRNAGNFIRDRFADWKSLNTEQMPLTMRALDQGQNTAILVNYRFNDWKNLNVSQMLNKVDKI